MSWSFTSLSGNYCPRQFEYHPNAEGLIFGTMYGEVVAVDAKGSSHTKSLGYYGMNKNDTILGLCWLKNNSNKFISGSSNGRVCCVDASVDFEALSKAPPVACMPYSTPPVNLQQLNESLFFEYECFERLTSVHVNCCNDLLLLSGYARDVRICDLETGRVTHKYTNIHRDHINISRFANLSPHLFATSSFDGTIKTWDLRQRHYIIDDTVTNARQDMDSVSGSSGSSPATTPTLSPVQPQPSFSSPGGHLRHSKALFAPSSGGPIYTVKCNSGVVMINFSCDDVFLLASALDNEINQYLFLNGQKHLTYQIPRTGLAGNFTRAYYSASGRHAITGACEESTVKLLCTYTGETLSQLDIYPGKKDKSLYIQSLRGSPVEDNKLCVLANYRDMSHRELVMATYNGKTPLGSIRAGIESGSFGYSEEAIVERQQSSTMVTDLPSTNDLIDSSSAGRKIALEDVKMDVECTDDDRDDYKLLAHNLFLSFYSPTYIIHLRSLRRLCRRLIHSYEVLESAPATADENSSDLLPLLVQADITDSMGNSDGGTSNCVVSDGRDIVILIYPPDSGQKGIESDHASGNDWVLLPVHAFVLAARCPSLMNLRQGSAKSTSLRLQCVDNKAHSMDVPALAVDRLLPKDVVYILPLLLDYMYVGNSALDLTVLRYYTLIRMVKSNHSFFEGYDSSKQDQYNLKELLSPLLGEYLREEIALFDSSSTFEADILGVPNSVIEFIRSCDDQKINEVGFPFDLWKGLCTMLLVSIDDACWRHNMILVEAFTCTLTHMWLIADVLHLPVLSNLIDQYAQQSINCASCIGIYTAAEQYKRVDLIQCCAIFIVNHQLQLQYMFDTFDISRYEAVRQMQLNLAVDVLTRKQIKERIESYESARGFASTAQQIERNENGNEYSESDFSVEKYRWMLNEIPYFQGSMSARQHEESILSEPIVKVKDRHINTPLTTFEPAICLPRYLSHTCSLMLNEDLVILGGMHLERNHNLNSRILVYNISSDTFSYKDCGGTYLPKTCTMACSASLQKHNASHLLLLGGKLRKCEVPHSNSTLLEHLQIVDDENEATLQKETKENDSSSSDIRGGNAHFIAKSSLLWNENADREELSSQTAAMRRASIARDREFIDASQVSSAPEKRKMKLHTMGLLYELNYLTMTWTSPTVSIGCERNTNRSYQASSGSSLDRIEEIINGAHSFQREQAQRIHYTLVTALRRRVGQSLTAIYPQDLRYRCTHCLFRTNFFAREIATCQCEGDIFFNPYRGDEEILHSQFKNDNSLDTDNCVATNLKTSASEVTENCNREPVMDTEAHLLNENRAWLLQFGGYCGRESTISNDLHVLICSPSLPFPSKVTDTPRGTVESTIRKQAQLEYKYRWVRVSATGATPSARFAHSSTLISAQTAKRIGMYRHTRILYYGGMGYGHDYDLLASLRINSSVPLNYKFTNERDVDATIKATLASAETESYLHWETVSVHGANPGRRHGHTMVYLEDKQMCALYGGVSNEGQGLQACSPDIWLLRLEDVSHTLVNTSAGLDHGNNPHRIRMHWQIDSKLHCYWVKVDMLGIPPSPRTRHICATSASVMRRVAYETDAPVIAPDGNDLHISRNPTDTVLLIFGGFDEQLHQNEIEDGTFINVDFDNKQKDSIMHVARISPWDATRTSMGLWETFYKRHSKFYYVPFEPVIQPKCCTLSHDMMRLLEPLLLQNFSSSFDDATATRMNAVVSEFHRFMEQQPTFSSVTNVTDSITDMRFELVHHPVGEADSPEVIAPCDSAMQCPVHSSIIARRSEWVRIMLSSSMTEAQTRTIRLHGTDPIAFVLILLYLYTDAVMFTTVGDVVAVLELAIQYNLQILSKKCEGILIRLVSKENVCELLEYADCFNLRILKVSCIAEILRYSSIRTILYDQEHIVAETNVITVSNNSSNGEAKEGIEHVAPEDVDFVQNFIQLSPELQQEVRRVCLNEVHAFVGYIL